MNIVSDCPGELNCRAPSVSGVVLKADTGIPNGTFFSSSTFADAWVQAFPERDRLFPIQVSGSGPPRVIYTVQRPLMFGRRRIEGGPYDDFCVSPGWVGELESRTLEGILQQLKAFPTQQFVWRVRFDHQPLVQGLRSLGLTARPREIHVIPLEESYEKVYSGYSPSLRNHISKAYRRGLVIREVRDLEDLSAFQHIYRVLADQKRWSFVYPLELSLELVKLRGVARFFIAEFESRVAGGALFVRDGCSVMYVAGVSDRAYTKLYPAAALIDQGIRWALELGANFFNLGNAGSNVSLAQFKSYFGSHKETDWDFEWSNPLINCAARVKRGIVRGIGRVRHQLNQNTAVHNSLSLPSKATPRNSQMSWSERASLDELSAVLYAGGPERENLLMHAATLTGARKIPKLKPTRGQRPVLLDLGCGNGRMLRLFGSTGMTLIGTDTSYDMLMAARRHGIPEGAAVVQTSGTALPLANESLDVILACGVLKYTLFPSGWRCLAGGPALVNVKNSEATNSGVSFDDPYNPAYSEVAREMYRLLKPGGLVFQLEMFVNSQPALFAKAFQAAGFVNEQTRVLRRYEGRLERGIESLLPSFFRPAWIVWAGQLCAEVRYWFDNPERNGSGFKDYYFVWRKPSDAGQGFRI